ncbi:MAG: exodeoxyribonuclease VII small subunit [Planctomycetaceae bacterium]
MAAKKSAKNNSGPEPAIEDSLQELQDIVSSLESGQPSLKESLEQFERGMALLKGCHEQLEQAAQRIEIVTRVDQQGNLITDTFDVEATFGSDRDKSLF